MHHAASRDELARDCGQNNRQSNDREHGLGKTGDDGLAICFLVLGKDYAENDSHEKGYHIAVDIGTADSGPKDEADRHQQGDQFAKGAKVKFQTLVFIHNDASQTRY